MKSTEFNNNFNDKKKYHERSNRSSHLLKKNLAFVKGSLDDPKYK